MKEWFADWFDSPYYHILYKNRSDFEAESFVGQIVDHFDLKANETLLDLACGKGRHSKAFAEYGLDVTGLDLSKNSIELASQFEKSNLHFYVHDMRRTFRTNYYDIVCNLFTSFGYFKSAHDNQLAAKCMFQAAKKNGMLLIDFVNKSYAIDIIEAKPMEELEFEAIRFEVRRSYTTSRLIKQISIFDGDKVLSFEESLNSFTFDEMNSLFCGSGFKLAGSFGNYLLAPYDQKSSPRMILVYTK